MQTLTITDHLIATSDTAAETVTIDQSNNQHDCNAEDRFAEVVTFVESHDCKPRGGDEFDEFVWEMTLAVQECKINTQAKNKLVNEWASMEDNQQRNNLLAAEIDQLMDLEVVCHLKEMSIEGNDEGSEDEHFLEEKKN